MLGLAQKLFLEQGGQLPKQAGVRPALHPAWPLLERMLSLRHLAYVDYAFVELLLRGQSNATEPVAAFLCHLSVAARAGHLCICVDHADIMPDPIQAWTEASENARDQEPATPEEFQQLRQLIIEGATNLPTVMITQLPSETCSTPICKNGPLFYLQKFWLYEKGCLDNFERIRTSTPTIALDMDFIQTELSRLDQSKTLLPEQAQAIKAACQECFTIICGGPGTGKTYTAGLLIKVFWKAMSPEQRRSCDIALAAPTGKAAANLQQSLARAIKDLDGFAPLQATTLHSLLGIRSSGQPSETSDQLTADLIIVDESSMIDAKMMMHLLQAVKSGARLVMLGDRYQLPPVGAGALFSDFMQTLDTAIELKKCLRAELQGIIHLAEIINRGDSQGAIALLNSNQGGISRLHFEAAERPHQFQQTLLHYALPHFHHFRENINHPESILETMNKFRILSPLRQGPYGIDALNGILMRHMFQQMRHEAWFAAPIMIVRNDAKLELSNGETGILVRRKPHDFRDTSLQEGDYALFIDRKNEKGLPRKLPALILPAFEYAYCMSIHKSQGSEFDHVLLLMPEGSENFGREVLYTGVTRARKKLELWGSDPTLISTIDRALHRLSSKRYIQKQRMKDEG